MHFDSKLYSSTSLVLLPVCRLFRFKKLRTDLAAMSRAKVYPTNSGPRSSELTHLPPRPKDLSWDLSTADATQDRRHSSFSAALLDKDSARPEEDNFQKTSNQSSSIEERLLTLEREISQFASPSGYDACSITNAVNR